MATNYDLINQDFARPAEYNIRTEDNDWQNSAGQLWDPYDQYLQSLNTGTSFGIADDQLGRIQGIADFNNMTLDQWIKAGLGGDYTVEMDEYGTPIYKPVSGGAVNYGGFPAYNPADGNEWMLPLAIAGFGACDMGLFGDLFGGATGGGAGGFGGGGGGVAAAEGTAGLSAADIAGLTQMGTDAGLSGSALESIVASGGTMGSAAAGGGGLMQYLTPNPVSAAQNLGGGVENYQFPDGTTGAPVGSFNYPSGGFDWSSLLGNKNLLGSLLGAGAQGLSSYFASQAQQNAGDKANETLWNMFQQNRADLEPWRTAGVGALSRLTDLTTPGKQFDTMQADPGYQFRLEQGQKALDNRLRAGGKFYSGSALKAGTDYNQGFASNEFSNVYNRLAGLAGTGQAATNTTAQLGQSTAGAVANNQTDMGNARASGYMGIGGAVQGGINSYNQQNMLNQLLPLLTRGY